MKIFDPKFDLLNWIRGDNIMVANPDQEASVVRDLKTFIAIAGLFVGVVVAMIGAYTI